MVCVKEFNMKRILINATHAEEVRVALCNGNHLYDFDLENRTREQKKANIYKGHVTRVEPSLEAVFVEYGSARQGFLPIREIAPEYLSGDVRNGSIKQLIKEGDELIIQVEKEERGNKGAALSTYISLAGRYLVLMPNNPKGGGISRQISGKLREEMKQALASLKLPKEMSVIIRTAGIGRNKDELQHDLDHLLNTWQNILYQNQNFPSPRLVHQEASVVTRAVRDYLRDDIVEVWVDNEYAYNEAAHFIETMMPQQLGKLRKYVDYEPMFSRFGIEKQIETAYQREVRLPSGGSIVIDQTEAMVSIDINSSKSTKGADVSATAFHTNLEAADEIARQLRLRDMGGLIVIDFIDMATEEHQKQVENRIKEATKNDRARIQFAEISRFGLLEMSRQRLRPSLEEATGYLCPRCHGTGMIRDLRSLALSIMRQIEQKALQERHGEIQADVPTDIAAFLLNEKRDSLVYLERESGTRITILPHAHLESPEFHIAYNADGYAPSSYERIAESQEQEYNDRGYDTSDWHTEENENRVVNQNQNNTWSNSANAQPQDKAQNKQKSNNQPVAQPKAEQTQTVAQNTAVAIPAPSAVAWLSNLFAPTEQAQVTHSINSHDAAAAIESIVNTGAKSLGVQGQIQYPTAPIVEPSVAPSNANQVTGVTNQSTAQTAQNFNNDNAEKTDSTKRNSRKAKLTKKGKRFDNDDKEKSTHVEKSAKTDSLPKREPNSRRESRGEKQRNETLVAKDGTFDNANAVSNETLDSKQMAEPIVKADVKTEKSVQKQPTESKSDTVDINQVQVQVHKNDNVKADNNSTHISLDNSKGEIVETPVERVENVTVENVEIETAKTEMLAAVVPTDNTADTPVVTTPVTEVQAAEPSTPKIVLDVVPTQGRAKNDPREVYRAFCEVQQPTGTVATAPNTPSKGALPKITGTVGQFIAQYLTDAQAQIAEVGVAKAFIGAVSAYHAQFSQFDSVAPTSDNVQNADATEEFNQFFRNYGYHNLSQENLDSYHSLIAPNAQFHTTAGKTDARPAPVTQRASNDPRGQIVASSDVLPTLVGQNIDKAVKSIKVEQNITQNQTTYPKGSAGAFVLEKLGEEGERLIREGQFVSAYLKAQTTTTTPITTQPNQDENFEQNIEQSIQNYVEKDNVAKETLGNDTKTLQQELSQAIEELENALTQALSQTEDEHPKGKTSPASYKNMIESVAGQIKMPTSGGMVLNLATPKVTKPRTRKPKAEKAPAKTKTRTSKKVESAVIVKKTKADSETNAEANNNDSTQG